MSEVDQFIAQPLNGKLAPGERMIGCGLFVQPTKFTLSIMGRVPNEYGAAFLAAATNTRLFVFKTTVGGVFTSKAKPIARLGIAALWVLSSLVFTPMYAL